MAVRSLRAPGCLGPDHPDVAADLNYVGWALSDLGGAAEALPLLQWAHWHGHVYDQLIATRDRFRPGHWRRYRAHVAVDGEPAEDRAGLQPLLLTSSCTVPPTLVFQIVPGTPLMANP